MKLQTMERPKAEVTASVYCPICTHTVEARIIPTRKGSFVKPGQRCPRCGSSLDAACVLQYDQAA